MPKDLLPFMMEFVLDRFVDAPKLEVFDLCTKHNLLLIAAAA